MSSVTPRSGLFLWPLVGLVLLIVSLSLEWYIFHDVAIPTQDLFGSLSNLMGAESGLDELGSMFSGTSLSVSTDAFNGTINVVGRLPIWVVILVASVAALLGLLRAGGRVASPPLLILLAWGFAVAHVGAIFFSLGQTARAEFGPGPFVAAAGLLMILPSAFVQYGSEPAAADR